MKTSSQLALMLAAALGLLAVAYVQSSRLGDELVARAEVEYLERIPVLEER